MRSCRGFARAEGVAIGVVVTFTAAVLLIVGGETRRSGRLGEDLSKLRRIAAVSGAYASDHADTFWTFSWRAGQSLSQWPELNNAASDEQAALNQMVDILRRRAGRLDIGPISGLFPHHYYSHLPLLDYAGRLPDETFISAADEYRLRWSRDPLGFDQGLYQPAPVGAGSPAGKRWPYSTTFPLSTSFFDRTEPPVRVGQASTHSTFFTSSQSILRGKQVSSTSFPAHKAFLHDSNARHFGTVQPYCTYPEARLPILFVDGGVAIKCASEGNQGWQANIPPGGFTWYQYQPDAWEPSTFSGIPSEYVTGRFRWTRGFLDGRDFAGPEACTGQPGCP